MENDETVRYERIPKTFNCGGQQWVVDMVDRLDDGQIGECRSGECVVAIAEEYNRATKQSPDCCANTFYHELVHAILGNIGWDELNDDHKFVCSFAALLTEAMRDARFIVKTGEKE